MRENQKGFDELISDDSRISQQSFLSKSGNTMIRKEFRHDKKESVKLFL